jgi:hypothetical protein
MRSRRIDDTGLRPETGCQASRSPAGSYLVHALHPKGNFRMASPAEIAAQRLTWNMESWKSIELRSHEDFVNSTDHDPSQFSAFHCKYHYIETAVGQRMFEERLVAQGRKETFISINYTDGRFSASLFRPEIDGVGKDQIDIRQAFATEMDGRTHRPTPLNYFYVGLNPLPKVLSKAVHLGIRRHMDRDCDLFLFAGIKSGPGTTDFVYWLDHTSSIPLKVEFYDGEKARAEHRPLAVWNAESFDEVEGRHLPLKSEVIHFRTAGPHFDEVEGRYKVVVESVNFDRDYPKSTFWPVIGRDATVFDAVRNKMTVPKEPSAETRGTTAAPPIRAVESSDGIFSTSTLVMLMGVAILAAGLLLWWRRR